ncbi:MAG: hypothetical protein KDC91_07240, partial [Flavobacteriaceae bacterium]|nr:hypothetical protein [Flavobacteriaceae bacterium]
MKKLALKSIMLLSLVMGVSSCVNDDVKNETTELNLSREIPVEILDTSNLFQPVELEGNFDYWLTKNNDLVFYTQTSTHLNIFAIQGVPLRKLPNSSI